MMTLKRIAAAAAALALTTSAVAQGLTERMQMWEPLLGQWTIEATWSFGMTLEGKAEYRAGVSGAFVHARTWVSDNGGPTYLRYESTIAASEEADVYDLHVFGHDGTARKEAWRVEHRDGGRDVLTAEWAMPDGTPIREEMELTDASTLAWRVWSRPSAESEWAPLMNANWKKSGEEESEMVTMPIDSSLFEGSGAGVRQFSKDVTIDAPVERVYEAWTNGEVFCAMYDPERPELAANIDLAIGGRYEWLFDGKLGSNGCQVLSYVPNRMVSFSWNAPPTIATRGRNTWVVVEFDRVDDETTAVHLTHLGFGEGEAWDQTHDYFLRAWDVVLGRFKENLGE